MRAVRCVELGPADRLELVDVPDPTPGPGEVVVDVHAAALNFPDTLIIQGKYQFQPDLPFTPGGEAAGVVSAVGEGVSDVTVGSRVVSVGIHGAFAEKWAVPAATLICSLIKSKSVTSSVIGCSTWIRVFISMK